MVNREIEDLTNLTIVESSFAVSESVL